MSGPRLNRVLTATIANGGTVSGKFETGDIAIMGLVLPATFTGTAITFSVSVDDTTYQTLCDTTGATVSVTVAQAKSYNMPVELAAWPFFKVVSGTAEGAARTLLLAVKG